MTDCNQQKWLHCATPAQGINKSQPGVWYSKRWPSAGYPSDPLLNQIGTDDKKRSQLVPATRGDEYVDEVEGCNTIWRGFAIVISRGEWKWMCYSRKSLWRLISQSTGTLTLGVRAGIRSLDKSGFWKLAVCEFFWHSRVNDNKNTIQNKMVDTTWTCSK